MVNVQELEKIRQQFSDLPLDYQAELWYHWEGDSWWRVNLVNGKTEEDGEYTLKKEAIYCYNNGAWNQNNLDKVFTNKDFHKQIFEDRLKPYKEIGKLGSGYDAQYRNYRTLNKLYKEQREREEAKWQEVFKKKDQEIQQLITNEKKLLTELNQAILKEDVELRLPLKDVPSELWSKIEVDNDWDREYIEAENDKSICDQGGSRAAPMTLSHGINGAYSPSQINRSGFGPWYRKFKSQELLDNYKKYVDINREIKHYSEDPGVAIKDLTAEHWFTTHLPTQLTKFLKDENKLFIRDGYGKMTSREAFEFLQSSVVETREVMATIRLTQNNLELEQQIKELQSQIQLKEVKVGGLETELEDQRTTLNENIDALGEEKQDLKNQIEDLQKQLQQVKTDSSSSSLVKKEEKLDLVEFLNLRNISIQNADLNIFLKKDRENKENQKEVDLFEVLLEGEDTEDQAHLWLSNITDSINKEVNEYGGNVKREKKSSYHPRGHYFIFYADGGKDHWLALFPRVDKEKIVTELGEGHTHKTFILEFDKPVSKFIDVYTCLGCGGSNQFTDLHSDYGYGSHEFGKNLPTDSWDTIHKNLPFDPWYDELNNPITRLYTYKDNNGKEVKAMRLYTKEKDKCLGSDYDVWPGATIQDPKGKTFDRAYGYINSEGTLEWRLERTLQGIQESEKWALNQIGERSDSLWENEDFTSWKDKSPYQQWMMRSVIEKCLEQRNYELVFKYSGGEKSLKINEFLLVEVKEEKFEKLIKAKSFACEFLEEWIKKILAGSNVREEIKEDERFISLKDKPLVIREIWSQQVERFIEENKAQEFYAEQHQEGLTQVKAQMNIGWFYKEVTDNLKLENQLIEAQIEVLAE